MYIYTKYHIYICIYLIPESPYDYEWKLIKHPDDFQGTQTGIQTDTLKLTTLTIGHYEFKVGYD